MAGTSSSMRSAEHAFGPQSDNEGVAGSKRKADASSPRRDPKAHKTQQTIEQGFAVGKSAEATGEGKEKTQEEGKKEDGATSPESGGSTAKKTDGEEGAIQESTERKSKLPTNIIERGIVYFFFRNRVGIDEAESVGDLQRTYFVLRPLPDGAKIGDGPIQDLQNNRLFALPKKTFPKSHRDRFMAFVEKSNTTIENLKEDFFKGEQYETETRGTQHTEPVTPVAEGVYGITRTEDRTTHFVYAITIPSDIGEVQEDLGLRSQGSFIITVKNPERPGPASARLPKSPEFPDEFIEEFRGLAWVEAKSKYLDYANCQVLLIGENIGKAVEPTSKDQRHDKETPQEELEQLEHEDELRIHHLAGDDSVFEDLSLSKKDYPSVPTTW